MTRESGEEGDTVASSARDTVARYRSGVISFPLLVDSLYAIISHFDESEWLQEVRGQWLTLEQVYAVDLDRGELGDMSTQSLELIDEAVGALEDLLSQVE